MSDDFANMLLAEQGTQTRTVSKVPEGSTNVRAIVLGSKTKSTQWAKGGKSGTITSTSVHFKLVGAKKNIQAMGGRSNVIEETAMGIRFRRSGNANKKQIHQTYHNGLKAFKLSMTAANGQTVDLSNIKPDPAFVPAGKDDKLDTSFFMNFDEEPFRSNPFLCLDDDYTYWADVKGSFMPAKITEVSIEGLHFDPWVADPKVAAEKKKKQLAASVAAATGGSLLPTNEVEAEIPERAESEWTKFDVRDPATNLSLRYTTRASALNQTLTLVNSLPLELRIPQLFDIDHQIFMNPAIYSPKEAHRVYAVPVSVKARPMNDSLEFGSFVGPNQYSNFVAKTSHTYGPKDPETFYFEGDETMGKQKSATYPINVIATNFQKLPAGSTDDALERYPGYTKIINYKGSPYAIQQVNVKGRLFADQCRGSCIVNLQSWICVNNWKPIPAYAVMQPDKNTPSDPLEMSSMAVGWDMVNYLKEGAIHLPLKFVQEEILGGRTILQTNLGIEKYKRYEGPKTFIEDRPIENKGNLSRGTRDLVNLSEFTGDVTMYFTSPGWKFCLLLVPNQSDVKEWMQTDFDKYKLFNEYMDKFQSPESKAQMDKNPDLLKEFLTKVFGSQYKVTSLYANKRDFCTNLFAYKDPETLFSPAVLNGKHYKQYEPFVIKAPEEDKAVAAASQQQPQIPAATASVNDPPPPPPSEATAPIVVNDPMVVDPIPPPLVETLPIVAEEGAEGEKQQQQPTSPKKQPPAKKRPHKEIVSNGDSDSDEDAHHNSKGSKKKEAAKGKKHAHKKARKHQDDDDDDESSS